MALKPVRTKHSRKIWKMAAPGIQEFRNQDYAEALPLLKASAHSGSAEAQCLLGNIYQLGLGGIGIDETKAMQWYYRSANQGYSVATNNLAGMVWLISREAASALYQLAYQQDFDHSPALSA